MFYVDICISIILGGSGLAVISPGDNNSNNPNDMIQSILNRARGIGGDEGNSSSNSSTGEVSYF